MFTTTNPNEATVNYTARECVQYALDLLQYEKAIHQRTLEFVQYGLEHNCYDVTKQDERSVKAELLMWSLRQQSAYEDLEGFLLEMNREFYLADDARPMWRGHCRKSFGLETAVALEYVHKHNIKSYNEFFA